MHASIQFSEGTAKKLGMVNHRSKHYAIIGYAELIRQFLSGRMTNHQYEDRCDAILDNADMAVDQIYCELWAGYCDFREHYLGMKHGMTREARRTTARWIMFLHSNRPYEYPTYGCLPMLISICTLGMIRKPDPKSAGDSQYWPYFRESDFRHDLARPKLLAGATVNPAPNDG